jgi:hypothetical protein
LELTTLFASKREKLTRILLLRPEEEMYADALDLLREVFESEFGYFGYINREGHLVCPSGPSPVHHGDRGDLFVSPAVTPDIWEST